MSGGIGSPTLDGYWFIVIVIYVHSSPNEIRSSDVVCLMDITKLPKRVKFTVNLLKYNISVVFINIMEFYHLMASI